MLCHRLLASRCAELIRAKGRRTLFTDDFLGVSVFKDKSDRARQEMESVGVSKSQLTDKIQNQINLIQVNQYDSHILSKDVRKVIYTSRTQDEIRESGQLLRQFVMTSQPSDDQTLLKNKSFLLKDFISLCHLHSEPNVASGLWRDEEFMKQVGFVNNGILSPNMPATALCYLDLLYNRQMYQEMFQEVARIEALVTAVPLNMYIIYVMACLKLNTPEAYGKASEIYNKNPHCAISGKFANPYSLLVLNHGPDPNLAYEVVSVSNKKSVLRTGLMAYILSKLGRPVEACLLLEETLSESESLEGHIKAGSKLVFSIEVIKAITNCVAEQKDTALNRRLASIFNGLDRIAVISEQGINDVITSDIDASNDMKYRRAKSRTRAERKIVQADDGKFDNENHAIRNTGDSDYNRTVS